MAKKKSKDSTKVAKKKKQSTFKGFSLVLTQSLLDDLESYNPAFVSTFVERIHACLNSFCLATKNVKHDNINYGLLTYNLYGILGSVVNQYILSNAENVNRFTTTTIRQVTIHVYPKKRVISVVMDRNMEADMDTFEMFSTLTEFIPSTLH